MKIVRRIFWIVIALLVVTAIVVAVLPKPVPVEMGTVTKGLLVVTAEGEAKTRIKDRFVVSAPVSGQMPRFSLHPGDQVKLGQEILFVSPTDAPLLDARSKAQAEAQVKMARAAKAQANTRVGLAKTALEFEQTELGRMKQLFTTGGVAQAAVDAAELKSRSAQAELESAKFGERIAQFQLETAEASLLRFTKGAGEEDQGARVAVRAPIDGTVLRVFQESAGPVVVGAPLVELGDRRAMEVVIELLSTDAVQIKPDALVQIDRWGGDHNLEGRVRLIEPSGYTKISALGIEEQRVNVIADFTGPVEQWSVLGDNFRVHARIVVWQKEDAVKIPISALFRQDKAWAVYTVENGKAKRKEIEIGRRNQTEAEIQKGLNEGETLIVHPSDLVKDGIQVAAR